MCILPIPRIGQILLLSVLVPGAALFSQSVTFVDGVTLEADVLFQHPHAPLLVVRSPAHRTVQTFPLAEIQNYQIGGRTVNVSPARALTEDETIRRQRNGAWVDVAGPGQIGKYATETWEKKPLLVWARPGESGDGLSFENWLDETGKPLSKDPWTREKTKDSRGREQPESGVFEGDILLPMSDRFYQVLQAGNRDHLGAFTLRHLTVEDNAEYAVRYTVTGNLWMKDGSKIGAKTQTGGLGSGDANKHTVARFCNWHDIEREPQWPYAKEISHWARIDTGDKGSLEVVGLTRGPGDRLTLDRGTVVVSTDSYLGCGNRAGFFTRPGTTIILLDGARIASHEAIQGGSGGNLMGTYGIGGTILFGTPEKPLTRDLDFSACLYPLDRLNRDATPSDRASGASWVFGPESHAIIHSADPSKARVVFAPRSRDLPLSGGPRDLLKAEGRVRLAPDPAIWEHPDMPKGVIALFRGKTDFDGVVFDGFYEGGIIADPAASSKWKNVHFGDRNLAPPAQLLSPL